MARLSLSLASMVVAIGVASCITDPDEIAPGTGGRLVVSSTGGSAGKNPGGAAGSGVAGSDAGTGGDAGSGGDADRKSVV